MSTPYDSFKFALEKSKGLAHLGKYVEANMTSGAIFSDSFRAALVFAVASLDLYLHRLCQERILSALRAKMRYSALDALHFSSTHVFDFHDSNDLSHIQTGISRQLNRMTFQRSEDVGKAMALCAVPKPWKLIQAELPSAYTGRAAVRLDLIVDRRNSIVHQGDEDPTLPGTNLPMDFESAESVIEFIDALVSAIERVVARNPI
jgi:hypothetical protein